jgi:hypothetical protein
LCCFWCWPRGCCVSVVSHVAVVLFLLLATWLLCCFWCWPRGCCVSVVSHVAVVLFLLLAAWLLTVIIIFVLL